MKKISNASDILYRRYIKGNKKREASVKLERKRLERLEADYAK